MKPVLILKKHVHLEIAADIPLPNETDCATKHVFHFSDESPAINPSIICVIPLKYGL